MHLLQKFLPGKTFAPIVTRDFRPPKPDPAGILHIAEQWGLEDRGEGLIMVCAFTNISFETILIISGWKRNTVLTPRSWKGWGFNR